MEDISKIRSRSDENDKGERFRSIEFYLNICDDLSHPPQHKFVYQTKKFHQESRVFELKKMND